MTALVLSGALPYANLRYSGSGEACGPAEADLVGVYAELVSVWARLAVAGEADGSVRRAILEDLLGRLDQARAGEINLAVLDVGWSSASGSQAGPLTALGFHIWSLDGDRMLDEPGFWAEIMRSTIPSETWPYRFASPSYGIGLSGWQHRTSSSSPRPLRC